MRSSPKNLCRSTLLYLSTCKINVLVTMAHCGHLLIYGLVRTYFFSCEWTILLKQRNNDLPHNSMKYFSTLQHRRDNYVLRYFECSLLIYGLVRTYFFSCQWTILLKQRNNDLPHNSMKYFSTLQHRRILFHSDCSIDE